MMCRFGKAKEIIMRKYLLLFIGLAFLGCDNSQEYKTTYHSHKLDSVPYSESVQVGNMLYISGQIANMEDDYTKIIDGGIRPQVNQTMMNIKSILKKHNSTMDEIIKCTCILANGDDWSVMSEEYVKYFKSHKPARTTFGGAELGDGILVEIECIAKLK
jgi:reactive intermediate/imine deaminase